MRDLENMAGLGILKTLSSFDFPKGEPEYTKEVALILKNHAEDLQKEDDLEGESEDEE